MRLHGFSDGASVLNETLNQLREDLPAQVWAAVTENTSVIAFGADIRDWPADLDVFEVTANGDFVPGLMGLVQGQPGAGEQDATNYEIQLPEDLDPHSLENILSDIDQALAPAYLDSGAESFATALSEGHFSDRVQHETFDRILADESPAATDFLIGFASLVDTEGSIGAFQFNQEQMNKLSERVSTQVGQLGSEDSSYEG